MENPIRTTPWNVVEAVTLVEFASLKPYSIRNGPTSEIVPYRFTIPRAYHWVPISGLAPNRALDCIDGFIRCYKYMFTANKPTNWEADDCRLAAILLGVSRAVMIKDYDLAVGDINPKEIAEPLLAVNFYPNATVTYDVLIADTSPNIDQLTSPLALTNSENEIIKVVLRCAPAIIPLQGHNLIVDGHHYLTEKSQNSFRAFWAVERQVWVPRAFREVVKPKIEMVRDIMWHKAGHPVMVSVKENAATSLTVKQKLQDANLGSASARLPALETEVRVAETYLKLCEAVDAVWVTMGGSINLDHLRFRIKAVKLMPRAVENLPQPIDIGGGVRVNTRSQAIAALKETLTKNSDKVARAFGFYCAMSEAESTGDTLRMAYSLTKLKKNNMAQFFNGVELYKDYRAFRARARARANAKAK